MKAFQIKTFLIAAVLSFLQQLQAQEGSANFYFEQAKEKAFTEKDFSAARQFCWSALQADANFHDATIFLGRLYAWDHQYDSARKVLRVVLQKNPKETEALIAAVDVALWDGQYTEAKKLCEEGLKDHPKSAELLLRKAQVLYAERDYYAATKAVQSSLQHDSANVTAKALASALKDHAHSNSLSVYYEYYSFNKPVQQTWRVGSLEYLRQTNIGPLIARISYADRQYKKGWQYEGEAYPKLGKSLYAYVNLGLSADSPVFPKSRSGFSLFKQLPKAWEVEGGLRYLKFDENVLVYTASVSKYLGNYWLNAKAFVNANDKGTSQSYFLTGRYYYGKANNYLSLGVGRGLSPDENRNIQLTTEGKLITQRLTAGIRHSIDKNSLLADVNLSKDETAAKENSNQLNFRVGYQRRF